jgi:DivIVA protein
LALDRQSIEKRDFPVGRRGYETEAVDAHLAVLADEYESLRRSSRRRTESLATAASEQVRAIVEAAESSAAEIQRQAEGEAREIGADAKRDAEQTRTRAAGEAREHVEHVSAATDTMLQRLEAMDSELNALVESLRTGANRLVADLSLLRGNMDELRSAAVGGGAPSVAAVVEIEAEELVEPEDALEDLEERESSTSSLEAVEERETAPASAADADAAEGARLIALHMALNGTPRNETARYLEENFDLADRDALLDEVYSRVQ